MKDFIESLPISFLHIFTYSERPNTKALELKPKVPTHEKQLRSKILHEVAEQKANHFYLANIGRDEKVLWESVRRKGLMEGFTSNYIRVKTPWNKELINTITTINLPELTPEGDFIIPNSD